MKRGLATQTPYIYYLATRFLYVMVALCDGGLGVDETVWCRDPITTFAPRVPQPHGKPAPAQRALSRPVLCASVRRQDPTNWSCKDGITRTCSQLWLCGRNLGLVESWFNGSDLEIYLKKAGVPHWPTGKA